MKFLKSKKWPVIYGIFLMAFTVYVLLDTFVIPRSYAVAKDTMSSLKTGAAASTGTAAGSDTALQSAVKKATSKRTASDGTQGADSASAGIKKTGSSGETSSTSYRSGSSAITVNTYRENDTDIYVADITLSSADQLKAAFANDTYGKNITEKTSETAEDHNAVLAINGDYYGAQNSGYVIRNGTLYRDRSSGDDTEDLVVYSDGTFDIVKEGDYTAQELLDKGAWQVFSFGPGLIENGEVTVTDKTEVQKAMASNPRTAIGQIDSLHYVFVVADGRTDSSSGLSVKELADFMADTLGCKTAYNLDGGGSSTMYFNGDIVNEPTTNGKISERSVSDIVYIGKE